MDHPYASSRSHCAVCERRSCATCVVAERRARMLVLKARGIEIPTVKIRAKKTLSVKDQLQRLHSKTLISSTSPNKHWCHTCDQCTFIMTRQSSKSRRYLSMRYLSMRTCRGVCCFIRTCRRAKHPTSKPCSSIMHHMPHLLYSWKMRKIYPVAVAPTIATNAEVMSKTWAPHKMKGNKER